uniref:Uncharacterized protein n=1 Tax=Oryza glumipatula TaxID=40148 RepID=A0A0E0AJG9_9ORYZ
MANNTMKKNRPTCHRLFQYRTISLTRVFPVGGAAAADEQGLPARAFDTSFPRIQVSLALSILDPDDVSSPLAVLELISTAPRLRFSGEVSNLCNALQAICLSLSIYLQLRSRNN